MADAPTEATADGAAPGVADPVARWRAANQEWLTLRATAVGHLIAGDGVAAALVRAKAALVLARMEALPSLSLLARRMGLQPFEEDVVVLAAATEIDADLSRQLLIQDPRGPSFALALARLPGAYWNAFAPTAPLRSWRLIVPERDPFLVTTPFRVDERILNYILGISHLDLGLTPFLRELATPESLHPGGREAVDAVLAAWRAAQEQAQVPVVALGGGDRTTMTAVAGTAAAAVGMRPFRLAAGDIPRVTTERHGFCRLFEREWLIDRAALVVDATDASDDDERALRALVDGLTCPVLVVGVDGLWGGVRPVAAIPVPAPRRAELVASWKLALGPLAEVVNGATERVSGQFRLGPSDIHRIGAVLRTQADDTPEALTRSLWSMSRAAARPGLATLAQAIQGTATWPDLILPAEALDTLHALAAQVRHRGRVHEDWGMGPRGSRGLGIAALFAGPSGTGKTLAAEVLAAELELDLYRVDLSAVVSKYIGETEKNLRRIFDAAEGSGAVLLFDEADALFGKRSEVRDSHDRYANIEVSYLLQRMESYGGLAILTTNQKKALDGAFLRRLRFVVDFPFPEADLRARIWARAFPAATPTRGLDPARLARLNVAGGNIRNISLMAAFFAAEEAVPVGMAQVLRAARIEYQKLGKPLTELDGGTR